MDVEGGSPCGVWLPTIWRMLLADVAMSHSLTEYAIARGDSSASRWQAAKKRKYVSVAARLGAELLNVCVDATGGMVTDASS